MSEASKTAVMQSLVEALNRSNKLSKRRNKLAQKQYHQSLVDYEQAERLYLIEKSKLQPSFRIEVTEFLLCEPDFMNDPEQAGEAKFLSLHGVDLETRVLRIQLHVRGEKSYMRPSIVTDLKNVVEGSDERLISMSESLYFLPVQDLAFTEKLGTSKFFLVYRDKTTLPVIHRYRLTQQPDSDLRRWSVEHLDSVFAKSNERFSNFHSSELCANIFSARE